MEERSHRSPQNLLPAVPDTLRFPDAGRAEHPSVGAVATLPHARATHAALLAFAARAEAARVPWPIDPGEFDLAGTKVRPGRPTIHSYRHRRGSGLLHVDIDGRSYRFTPTPNSPSAGRFTTCDIRPAVFGARLHHIVEPVFADAPGADPPDAAPSTGIRRRGHLSLVHSA